MLTANKRCSGIYQVLKPSKTKNMDTMLKRFLMLFLVISAGTLSPVAQESRQKQQVFRVDVDLVQVNVAVTDGHGNYLTGLKPSNFVVTEDGIAEKIATF